MSPLDYMFSDSILLNSINARTVSVICRDDLPVHVLGILSTDNAIAFDARKDASKWAFYRVADGVLEIASPFENCRLPLGGVDSSEPIGLLSVHDGQFLAGWEISSSACWSNARGEQSTPNSLKATRLPDGSFEPLHSSMSLRGMGTLPDSWTTVLLPSAPERVYSEDGRARIDADGRIFTLPAGLASAQVLAGKVQWGLPDHNGFFVLQPR